MMSSRASNWRTCVRAILSSAALSSNDNRVKFCSFVTSGLFIACFHQRTCVQRSSKGLEPEHGSYGIMFPKIASKEAAAPTKDQGRIDDEFRQLSAPSEFSAPLAGQRVLVVEDEYFVADDLARALSELGADVLGPVPDRRGGASSDGERSRRPISSSSTSTSRDGADSWSRTSCWNRRAFRLCDRLR